MPDFNNSILILGGHIIDPGTNTDMIGDLIIENERIKAIEKPGIINTNHPEIKFKYSIINASGKIVCPGFIDLHCHLRQPGYEEKETICTGTMAAAKGGYTTICCMPNTSPPIDNAETVKYIFETSNREGHVRVLPIGCITRKRRGVTLSDMKEMAEAGVAGFSDDGSPVNDDLIMEKALQNSLEFHLPIIDHCERITPGITWDMNAGLRALKLGLREMPEEAEEAMIKRDIFLNKKIQGYLHIAHVSTARSVGIIRRAKEDGIQVTAEVTPHHLTLSEEIVSRTNTNAKVNPPLRTEADIEALIEGLNHDIIDVIATDHAPHTIGDKNCEFEKAAFGISVFETALGSLMGLVHQNKISLSRLIAKLTCEPARIIKKHTSETGKLKAGYHADITIIDPERVWNVDTSKFASKGKNTPLNNTTLKGKVITTIYRGKPVFTEPDLFFEERKN